MKTTNKSLIKKLAYLGVLETQPIEDLSKKTEDDITIVKGVGEAKVLLDGITDEDLPLMIATEQLETTKSIKSMVKFTFVLGLVAAGIWLLAFLINLGNM